MFLLSLAMFCCNFVMPWHCTLSMQPYLLSCERPQWCPGSSRYLCLGLLIHLYKKFTNTKNQEWELTTYKPTYISTYLPTCSRKVFWRLWGLCHTLPCSLCGLHFQVPPCIFSLPTLPLSASPWIPKPHVFALHPNLFIYKAKESSLVPAGFLTAQFLQKP